MKFWLSLILFLLVSVPAFAQNAVLDDLKAARAQFGTPMTRAELGAMLNAVAWQHRSEGLGLERKDGGDTCPQPKTNIPVACDILRFPGNLGRDVLGDSDGRAVPQWGDPGPANAASFVAPVETAPAVTPPPPPPPAAEFVTKADFDAVIAALTARIAKLEAGSTTTPPPAGPPPAADDQLSVLKQILALLQQATKRLGMQ